MDPRLLARYESASGAAAYRRKYARSWIRRLSNRRELAVVRKALARAGAQGRLLDCPCGAGRLTPTLLRFAGHVTCVDLSEAMVAEARDVLAAEAAAGRVDFRVAPADALPFGDGAFDTAVCHRLLHHMATPGERAGVLAELARVASRRVVLSFADDSTRKARRQRRRGTPRRRHALRPEVLHAEAATHGLRPLGAPLRLNGFHSLVAVAVFDASAAP
jgi:ubiquinone/menaquinone biosynthesis C-methylase UbiE